MPAGDNRAIPSAHGLFYYKRKRRRPQKTPAIAFGRRRRAAPMRLKMPAKMPFSPPGRARRRGRKTRCSECEGCFRSAEGVTASVCGVDDR